MSDNNVEYLERARVMKYMGCWENESPFNRNFDIEEFSQGS